MTQSSLEGAEFDAMKRFAMNRRNVTRNYFPKLAFTLSDVVVLVSRQPFFHRSYITKCIDFAKKAASGSRSKSPSLVLIGNKVGLSFIL